MAWYWISFLFILPMQKLSPNYKEMYPFKLGKEIAEIRMDNDVAKKQLRTSKFCSVFL